MLMTSEAGASRHVGTMLDWSLSGKADIDQAAPVTLD
jgi:hypothetical protein